MVTMANLALLRWAHFGAILCLTLSRYIISSHSLTIPSSPLLILSSHNPSRLCEAVLKPAIAASQVQQPLLLSLSPPPCNDPGVTKRITSDAHWSIAGGPHWTHRGELTSDLCFRWLATRSRHGMEHPVEIQRCDSNWP